MEPCILHSGAGGAGSRGREEPPPSHIGALCAFDASQSAIVISHLLWEGARALVPLRNRPGRATMSFAPARERSRRAHLKPEETRASDIFNVPRHHGIPGVLSSKYPSMGMVASEVRLHVRDLSTFPGKSIRAGSIHLS